MNRNTIRSHDKDMLKSTLAAIIIVLSSLGCMDINPPKGGTVLDEKLLHSVKLPFERGMFAVGDTVTLIPKGLLINGDTVSLDRSLLRYRISPITNDISIDTSTGFLSINRHRSGYVTLYVNYVQEGSIRSDTARIYTSSIDYDVSGIEIKSLDSARGGMWALLVGSMPHPQYGITVYDINGDTIPDLPLYDLLTVFRTDSATGLRLDIFLGIFPSLSGSAGTFGISNISAKFGPIWLGVEGYLFGTHVRDSALYIATHPVESYAELSVSSVEQALVANQDLYLTSCGYISILNSSNYEVEIEFSGPTGIIPCGGEVPKSGNLTIPPFSIGSRQIGLSEGDSLTWKIIRVEPNSFQGAPRINSVIHVIPQRP